MSDDDLLPVSLRILRENVFRHAHHPAVRPRHLEAARAGTAGREIPFFPARVLLQDYTGVPAFVDLAAMRDVVAATGGDPQQVNPLVPVQVVVDHSLVVEEFGHPGARQRNVELEYRRNNERYRFLRWVQQAFRNTVVVPPGGGIVHQVNIEQLAEVVTTRDGVIFPDTVLGADSHTTMVNALGVLGWGVGGIEAESALLGEPVFLRLPPVIGVRLTGVLREGCTATDLVLTLTQLLRTRDTVGTFVEFHGPGLARLPVPDRATIANMSPEFGSTCAYFPIDDQTLNYLRLTGRTERHVRTVESYARHAGLWSAPDRRLAYAEDLVVDLGDVRPSVAGPSRPQDRVDLSRVRETLGTAREGDRLPHGAIAIAAITSCTNTANPGLMVAAGLLARNADRHGLRPRPWVKTTLAPGSPVVVDYLDRAGLTKHLDRLGFHLVGFGCTTCIGNSGPLADSVEPGGQPLTAVLSGNRNFEGRVNPHVSQSFLASPPLVVAYALAGTMDIDLTDEPLGVDPDGRPVHLRDLWPSADEVAGVVAESVRPQDYVAAASAARHGDAHWRRLPRSDGDRFAWDPDSRYVRRSPFADEARRPSTGPQDIVGARVLAVLGDTVTTDHITPSGQIPPDSPAGRYLRSHGVAVRDFNSYGSRRGNHEVAVRATFANPRLRNRLADRDGGWTRDLTSGEILPIHDAAERYAVAGVPLIVLAGTHYGTGSSRDWAAKGTRLLGVRAVLAGSFERIHRANLIGTGVLPLQFRPGDSVDALGLTGTETITIRGVDAITDEWWPQTVRVEADTQVFDVLVRLETAQEAAQYRHGGIIPYVLRRRWLGDSGRPA
ncbi:aconitate hydratase AcnA [Solwaraspora sp. WMMD1047]|uniref:aconitate hydratase AcnA n=1 Tax=Solwaraspora sp. WMMD1047 TaxID=3016102 RepID=UPI002416CE10|nr:aconitate hydratase AcnA [Solwaraspora sp. WMMD1047]MDG4834270.1 aconitate hydratase AcnA [Solwaraspora sp. WMMD1047]